MLILKKEFCKKMIAQSKKEFPNEACGILAGKDGRVERVFETNNTEKSPSSYFMEPREQFKVMKEMRTLGLDMIGIYHSHPETEAYPSGHDVELALYPDASYVIISIREKENPEIRSFKIVDGNIAEEEVVIE